MRISIECNNEKERFILLMNIGLMEALKTGAIDIETAENYLYSPYSVNKLKKMGLREEVIELINLGCELENVESLIPHELTNSINEIEMKATKFLKLLAKPNHPVKKWID